jgi:hypothetical protein
LKAQLDITKILPNKIIEKEYEILNEALDASFEKPLNYSDDLLKRLLQKIALKISDEDLYALQSIDLKNGENNCSSSVNFYREIKSLSKADKDVVAFGLFSN